MVFLILIGAHIFGYILAMLVFAYIVLGCFMEGLALMVLTIPVVYPMILGMGFDPIWFGVIITLVMEMSLITPPVGVNVFILSGITKDVPMYTIFRGIIPFWFAMLVCVILLTMFPQIALFLPMTMTN
jgi:TRAP-type C4-dicarboxylate transport system permease large subunit